jgi:hypothetical protein
VRVIDRAAEGHGRDVDAHVPHEAGLRAERQSPYRGVEPVGADHQVEAARCGAVERDVDAVLVLPHRDDRVVEQELGVVAGGPVEDGGQVTARELDLPIAGGAAGRGHGHAGDLPSGGVDDAHRGRLGGDIAQAGHDAHFFGYGQGGAAHVDRAAAGAQALRPLHDGGAEPVMGQPVGQGQAGDAAAGDQHASRGHVPHHNRTRCHFAMSAN